MYLFDPDRYRFLEGRLPGSSWREALADPLPIDNRTVVPSGRRHGVGPREVLTVEAVTERRGRRRWLGDRLR